MSEYTHETKMNFAKRIREGTCVICGKKEPPQDIKVQNIEMPTKDQQGGFLYHQKCIPKVTLDFAKAMLACKTLDDINNMLIS